MYIYMYANFYVQYLNGNCVVERKELYRTFCSFVSTSSTAIFMPTAVTVIVALSDVTVTSALERRCSAHFDVNSVQFSRNTCSDWTLKSLKKSSNVFRAESLQLASDFRSDVTSDKVDFKVTLTSLLHCILVFADESLRSRLVLKLWLLRTKFRISWAMSETVTSRGGQPPGLRASWLGGRRPRLT